MYMVKEGHRVVIFGERLENAWQSWQVGTNLYNVLLFNTLTCANLCANL
jgi:hypothetical protein